MKQSHLHLPSLAVILTLNHINSSFLLVGISFSFFFFFLFFFSACLKGTEYVIIIHYQHKASLYVAFPPCNLLALRAVVYKYKFRQRPQPVPLRVPTPSSLATSLCSLFL